MTEMSQMSEMSTVEGGAQPGKQGGASPKVLTAAVVVLLLFVVLMFLLLTGSETGEAHGGGDDGSDGGGDSGGGGGGFRGSGGRGSKKTTTEAPVTTPPTPPPTPPVIPIKRPESFIFCTLGPFLVSSFRLSKVPACDYFVYTDVFVYKDTVYGHDDPVSYVIFLEMAKKYRDDLDYRGYPETTNSSLKLQHYGISFAADSLLDLDIWLVKVDFTNLYKNYGILTAGLASYQRGDVSSDSYLIQLKSIMKKINDGMTKAQAGNKTILKTVFLGVKLSGATTSSQYDATAMSEIKSIGNIDLLILVSHLVQPHVARKCTIQPLSLYKGTVQATESPPTMERLVNLVTGNLKFRVALSVSMSVYMFTAKSTSATPVVPEIGKECELYYQLDYSELCGVKESTITTQDPLLGSATARIKGDMLIVFETAETIEAKMNETITVARNASVGLVWAVYDLQNDVATCDVIDKPQRTSYSRFRIVNDTMARDYGETGAQQTGVSRSRLW